MKINVFLRKEINICTEKKSKFLQIENQNFLQNNQTFYPSKINFSAFFDKKKSKSVSKLISGLLTIFCRAVTAGTKKF